MARRSWATPLLVCSAVIGWAACSGSDSESSGAATSTEPTKRPELLLGAPIVRQFEGLPLTDVAVSPDADRVAVTRGGEVCVISTSPDVPTSADRCSPFPSGIAPGSVTWSPDGTTLVFHHDLLRFGQEPDLVELELASGELTVLTDDGVPIVGGEGGDTDVAPAFTPDGTLYFFRLDPRDGIQAVPHRYVGDGVVTPTGPALAGIPAVAGRSVSDDSIVILLSGPESSELVSVDVNDGTSRSISIEGQSQMIADVAGPFTALATGPEFAPNDGDRTIKPAGLGRLGEIAWTDTALVYNLGPDRIVTLPLR